jgi:nucleotide-binding universal stress UspA family protein
MSYASFMVYVEADTRPEQRVRLAATLADRFSAALIGVSALAAPPPVVAGAMLIDGMIDMELINATLAGQGEWFRAIAGGDRRALEWRAVLDFPLEALSREARSADLVLVGREKEAGSAYRVLDPGAALLKLGRPALVVPRGVNALRAEHIVIGWKDTRESRRAVRDAVPLLQQQGTRVTIVEACGPHEERAASTRLEDVARYLTHHRVEASVRVLQEKTPAAEQLIEIARGEGADLLVSGAYGHSRLGEWIFGGMTRELLARSPICCLMSH